MNVFAEIAELEKIQGPVTLAIGVFDGVHLGHQAVLNRARDDAAKMGGTPVAITFDPHPAKFLRPERAPRLLTSTPHKLRLFEKLGYQNALVIPFDAVTATTPAEEFLRSLHTACTALAGIVVGCGWMFGQGREGTVQLIRETGVRLHFDAVEIPSVLLDGEPVSSTRIRKAVESGDLPMAARCLGRPFEIMGTVVPGRQLGRTIGFPTANLRAHNEQFPPNGVYAVRAAFDNRTLPGVANIGVRPTVESAGERLLEVHLFDLEEDIYGKDLEVTFVRFLRSEQKFSHMQALKTQIAEDLALAKASLSNS
jgi:riboflavin kinase/FMN adenylyltransferase